MAGTARELVELAVKVSECRLLAELYRQEGLGFSLAHVVDELMRAALEMEEAGGEEEVGG